MAMLIKKRGRNVWNIAFWQKQEDGKSWKMIWRTTGTTDEAEARKMLEVFEQARKGRVHRDAMRGLLSAAGMNPPKEIRLADLWQYYMDHAEKSGSPDQVRARMNMVTAFVRWCGERHPELERVQEVDERLAAEYWRWCAEDGKAPRTRNNIRSQLLLTWKGIQAEAGLPTNPWNALPRDLGGGEGYTPLTIDQVTRIFWAAQGFVEPRVEPGFWPAAFQMGLYTGLRLGDIAGLEWEELVLEEGVLILQPNKTKHWGTDRWAVHTLDAPWVESLPPRPAEGKGFVWPLAARKAATGWLRGFAGICAAAGVETEEEGKVRRKTARKLVTFHSLRHSFVSHLVATGRINEGDLVRQGNWSAEGVVREHYNSSRIAQAREAAKKVAEAFPAVEWRQPAGTKE